MVYLGAWSYAGRSHSNACRLRLPRVCVCVCVCVWWGASPSQSTYRTRHLQQYLYTIMEIILQFRMEISRGWVGRGRGFGASWCQPRNAVRGTCAVQPLLAIRVTVLSSLSWLLGFLFCPPSLCFFFTGLTVARATSCRFSIWQMAWPPSRCLVISKVQ